MTAMENSAGTLSDSYSIYLDSIDAKTKQFKATWSEFANTVVSSGVVKFFIELGTIIGEVATGIARFVGTPFAAIGNLFNSIFNSDKIVNESATRILKEYNEQITSLTSGQANFDALVERYGELANKTSLTTEEYQEFIDVSNQIAAITPSVVSGFDEQGNAILNCKGNVNELTDAYKELIRAANNTVLKDANTVFQDFRNSADKRTNGSANGLIEWLTGNYSSMTMRGAKRLSELMRGTDINEAVREIYNDKELGRQFSKLAKDSGFEQALNEPFSVFVTRALQEGHVALRSSVDAFINEANTESAKMGSIVDAYIGNALMDGYSNISPEMNKIINSIVDGFDFDFYSQFSNITDLYTYINNLLTEFDTLGADSTKSIDNFLDVQNRFKSGEASLGRYLASVMSLKEAISGLDTDAQDKFLKAFGLDDDQAINRANELMDKFAGKDKSSFDKWLSSLSSTDLDLVYKVSMEDGSGSYTLDQWRSRFNELKAEAEAEPIKLEVNFEEEQKGMKGVVDAIKESVTQTGLGEESVGALISRYKDLNGVNFEASKLFENTSNGIHVNTQELSRLESAYENLTRSNINDYLQEQVDKYNDLTDQINKADKATDTSSLYADRAKIAAEIQKVSILAAQYNGLTSAYNKWKNAQSMGEEGDMYDDITSNLKNIKELYDEGLIGTNKFRAAVGLMTNEDVSGMSADELVAVYDKAYPKMERYFKDGQTGVENFLNDINKLNSSWASMDENGVWNLDFNADEVAKQLGISTEGLEIIMRKLKDFGFDVNLEGLGEGLDKHVTDIDSALKSLDEAQQKLKDDLASGEITTGEFAQRTKEINEAKEAIEGLQESTSEVDLNTMSMDEAIAKIQELENAITTLTTEGIKIPVTLEGQYDDLNTLISSLGYKEGENGQSGSFELHVSDPEDAAGKIAEIQQAINTINANPNIDTNIKAAVTNAGEVTIAELQKIVDAPESSPKTITLSATDEATPIITTITDGDYNAEVKTKADNTAQTQIQAVADGDYTATIKTKFEFGDGGTVDPRELSDEAIAEYQKEHGEYSIPMLVDDSLQSGADKAIDTLDDVQEAAEETKSVIAEGWEWGIDEGLASQYSTIEELVARQNQTQSTAIPIDMSTIQSAGKGVSALVDAANKANVGAGFINALSNAYSNLASAMQAANEADPLDTNQTSVAAADLQEAATAFQTALSNVAEQTFASGDIPDVEIDADTSLAMAKIADLSSADCEVVYNPNTRAVDAYKPKNKSATVNYSANFSGISAPTLNGTVIYTRKYVGSDTTVTQSAKATGNAFPMGTLGGEVGRSYCVII